MKHIDRRRFESIFIKGYMGPWHRVSQLGHSFMVLLAMMFVIMAMNELKRNL